MENFKKKTKDVPAPADSASHSSGPVKVLRMDDVSASVFARSTVVQGEPVTFHSVSFSRSYRDAKGERKYSKNFDPEDLGKVMALAKQASEFIDAERGLATVADED